MKVIIPVTGGLDSTVAVALALGFGHEVQTIYLEYGHPYAAQEHHALRQLEQRGLMVRPNIIHVRGLMESMGVKLDGKDIWMPGRNALIGIIAAMHRPDEVWLAACKGEMHEAATDKNLAFFERLSRLTVHVFGHSKHGGVKTIVRTPFGSRSKLNVVLLAMQVFDFTPDDLRTTWSCMGADPTETIPCGNCMVCARRKGIFAQHGFDEEYQQDPYQSENGRAYLDKLAESASLLRKGQRGRYCSDRIEEVFPHWAQKLDSAVLHVRPADLADKVFDPLREVSPTDTLYWSI